MKKIIFIFSLIVSISCGDQTKKEVDNKTKELVVDSSKKTNGFNKNKNAYFGNLHIHTSWSFDGFTNGSITEPNDAYRWDFDGDGEFDDTSSGPQINRQFNTPGEYTVRLKIVHRGLSSSTTKTVYVEATNTLPQAAFTYKINGKTVTFDADNSRFDPDLDDTALRYEWDFNIQEDANGNGINDDDVESTEFNPVFEYSELRIYRVRLKVKDSLGMEGVVVRDVNLAMNEEDRKKNTYRSLRVGSLDQALTTLNLSVNPIKVPKGGTADIDVRILNKFPGYGSGPLGIYYLPIYKRYLCDCYTEGQNP